MEDETLQMTMLIDFFGDLLTEKQREYLDLYHNEDLSLSEIAEKDGITRQGAHDIITRAERKLAEIEKKTGVVKRWLSTQTELRQADAIARELLRLSNGKGKPAELAQNLVMILEGLKDS